MFLLLCLHAQSLQSCPTICNSMNHNPLGSSVHGIFPGSSTGVDCHFLLQGIFPTKGLNLGLLHCRQIVYHLNLQGSPKTSEKFNRVT